MKKTLIATSAIALGLAAVAAAPAFAAERPTASVRGYMGVGMFYGDNENNPNQDIGVMHDGELHFRWSGSSDNGLTFSGEIEVEAFSFAADQIDEYWTKVSGSFGSFQIGGDDTASEYMETGIIYAPLAKIGYYDAFGFSDKTGFGYVGTSTNGDDIGVYYQTPTFSGFTAAASWQPDNQDDGANQFHANPVYRFNGPGIDNDNIFSFGANYAAEFDTVSFSLSGGYEFGDADDSEIWSVGGQVGFSGFTIAAFYEDNPFNNGYDIAIGASYETGPWTFAGGWAETFDSFADPMTFSGWVTYAIAPGVSGTLGFEYSDDDFDDMIVAGGYLTVGF